jgi:hypothetical protein
MQFLLHKIEVNFTMSLFLQYMSYRFKECMWKRNINIDPTYKNRKIRILSPQVA